MEKLKIKILLAARKIETSVYNQLLPAEEIENPNLAKISLQENFLNLIFFSIFLHLQEKLQKLNFVNLNLMEKSKFYQFLASGKIKNPNFATRVKN